MGPSTWLPQTCITGLPWPAASAAAQPVWRAADLARVRVCKKPLDVWNNSSSPRNRWCWCPSSCQCSCRRCHGQLGIHGLTTLAFHGINSRVRRFRLNFFFASKRNEVKWDSFRFVFACSSENNGPIFSLVFASFRFKFFVSLQSEKKKLIFRFVSLQSETKNDLFTYF
jgi:hypothetical protein